MNRPTHLDPETGAAVFPEGHANAKPLPKGYWEARDLEAAIAGVKAEAMRRILEVAPEWKQRSDALFPDDPGAAERRAAIREIRDWSNDEEARLRKDAK